MPQENVEEEKKGVVENEEEDVDDSDDVNETLQERIDRIEA